MESFIKNGSEYLVVILKMFLFLAFLKSPSKKLLRGL